MLASLYFLLVKRVAPETGRSRGPLKRASTRANAICEGMQRPTSKINTRNAWALESLSVVSQSQVDTFILAGDNSSRMGRRHTTLLHFAGVPLIVGLSGGAKMVGSKATKAVDWALAIVLPEQHRYWGISNERWRSW